jgi:acyl carrier protein
MNVDQAGLSDWISGWLVRELKLGSAAPDRDATFIAYGMDSVHAMMLVGDLEDLLNRRLPPTLAWDHPTANKLAAHLAQAATTSSSDKAASAGDLLARIDQMSDAEVDALLQQELKQHGTSKK